MYYKAINHICEKDPEGPWIKPQKLLSWKKKKKLIRFPKDFLLYK